MFHLDVTERQLISFSPLNKELRWYFHYIFMWGCIIKKATMQAIEGQKNYRRKSDTVVMKRGKENIISQFKVKVLYVQWYMIHPCNKNQTKSVCFFKYRETAMFFIKLRIYSIHSTADVHTGDLSLGCIRWFIRYFTSTVLRDKPSFLFNIGPFKIRELYLKHDEVVDALKRCLF